VSAPLRWEELTEDVRPGDFTMEVVLDRLERDGDVYEPVLKLRQSLSQALAKVS
jgi:DNA primase